MPTRKWGTEKLVDTVSTGLQKLPKVAVLADGGFVVVWEDDNGPFSAIRAQRFDAAGNRVGQPLAIDVASGNNEVLPSVAALADGGFYVTWTQLVGADNYILGNVYDAAGALARSQTVVFAFGQDNNAQVARFGTGSAVAWEDPDTNQGDIDVRIFDAAGNGGAILTANVVTDGLQNQPVLAASPDGKTLVVVWVNHGTLILGRQINAGATDFTALVTTIGTATSHLGVADPAIAWLNATTYAVVWRETDSAIAGGNELKARIFDGAHGAPEPLTGVISVNSTITGTQQKPVVTGLPGGGFVVAWEDDSGVGISTAAVIRLQAFDGSGNKIGGETVVNTTTTGPQVQPSIAALADGRVVVTWTDATQSGSPTAGHALRMQIVDPRDGIVTGTPGSETLYGHDLVNDEISAGAGNDILFGLRGDDALYGGAGNDTLNGGVGADDMIGGTGNDTYIVDNVGDTVTENPNEGTDTVKTTLSSYTLGPNVENLTFIGTGSFAGTGNVLANIITGGAGNDTLTGGGGNDTLNGGAGADKMSGGTGNDTYIVDNALDVVTEAAGQGTDTVRTLLNSYTLGPTLENLTFIGTGSFTGNGNALDNVLTGGTGSGTLNGGGGVDTLVAGLHAAMTGGPDADQFLFTTPGMAAAPDTNIIADFTHGLDRVGLRDAGFNLGIAEGKGTSAPQALPAGLFSPNTNGTFATAGNRFAYDTVGGKLYYDSDGNAAGGARQLLATLTGHPTLTATDLYFVA